MDRTLEDTHTADTPPPAPRMYQKMLEPAMHFIALRLEYLHDLRKLIELRIQTCEQRLRGGFVIRAGAERAGGAGQLLHITLQQFHLGGQALHGCLRGQVEGSERVCEVQQFRLVLFDSCRNVVKQREFAIIRAHIGKLPQRRQPYAVCTAALRSAIDVVADGQTEAENVAKLRMRFRQPRHTYSAALRQQ